MSLIDELKKKYPQSLVWAFGDSPEMADELSALVCRGIKTASCGSLSAFREDPDAPRPGSYSIILNGQGVPVCVIRTLSTCLLRFSAVTEALAVKEGEGDLSLDYWRREHRSFFTREGTYSEDMEIVAEEFEVVELL